MADHWFRAKRFERMMKANDINPNGGPSAASPSSSPSTPTKKPKKDAKSTSSKGSAAKKRKIDDESRGPPSADDDDGTALKAERPQQRDPPGTPNAPKHPPRASRTASVFDKLNLSPNNEDKTKNVGSGLGSDNIIGGMYDGAEGTTAVVYADPNWGSVFPNHDNTRSAASSTDNPFDAFIHSDHPLHTQTSEFEAALSLNTEPNTTTEEPQYGNGQAKLKTESIFIED
jgi:hypothetical protein